LTHFFLLLTPQWFELPPLMITWLALGYPLGHCITFMMHLMIKV
jgi:hypothetical protein